MDAKSDSLLESLHFLVKFYGKAISREALVAGLPLVQNVLTPQLFVRAAELAGFSACCTEKPLEGISQVVLPVVLLLKENTTCVLLSYENGMANIVLGETSLGSETIALSTLHESYTGYAILIKPAYTFEDRIADELPPASTAIFWKTLFRYASEYKKIAVAALLLNVFALASSLFSMNVYDRVVPNQAFSTLWVLVIGMMLLYGFDLVLRLLRGYLTDITNKKTDDILSSHIMHRTLSVQMAAHPFSVGAFTNDFYSYQGLRDLFTSGTLMSLIDLPFAVIFLVIILMIGGPWLALIPILGMGIVLMVAYSVQKPMQASVEQAHRGEAQKSALLVESLENLELIKSARAEGAILKRWEQCVGVAGRANLRSRCLGNVAVNITQWVNNVGYVWIIAMGVYLIAKDGLTQGGLIACAILVGRVLAPLGQLANVLVRLSQARLGLQGLRRILEAPVERHAAAPFIQRATLQGKIDFREVSFTYPRQKTSALDRVTLHIKPGEKIGIIGRIGCGKTTLQKMIMKFYLPTEGMIRIDDIDIAQIDPVDLRKHMGYVSQDAPLLYGTVRDNITLGVGWVDDAIMIAAAELAGVDRFVHRHPSGYQMPIGERGEGVSGGQRQAIALARALLLNPAVLLMDEPTSSMDAASEGHFIEAIRPHLVNKTLILSTHKITLLALVDRILVLDQGRVVADGPKEAVLDALQKNTIRTTA